MGQLRLKIEESLAMFFLAATCIFVLIGAVGRSIGMPLIWSIDLAQLMFAWVCALAADITLQHNGHVVIDIMLRFIPKLLQKIMNIIWILAICGLLGLLIYLGVQLFFVNPNRVIGDTGLPYRLINVTIPVSATLMLITMLERLYKGATS
ncbi:transporter [Gammaproteobacteria bacterium]|nr:transporter [Gammaproteobacteria bacterium]